MTRFVIQAVEKLGLEGDVVNVSRGYARNFLVPNRLARLVPKIPEVSVSTLYLHIIAVAFEVSCWHDIT